MLTSFPPKGLGRPRPLRRLSVELEGDVPWVKIDAGIQSHPKVQKVGPWGELLHIRAICHSRLHLTDGLVTNATVTVLTIDFPPDIQQHVTANLLDAKLWEQHTNGFIIHDYSEWNQTKKEIEKLSVKRKRAGRLGGIAKGWQDAKQGARHLLKQKASRVDKSRVDQSRSETTTTSALPSGSLNGFQAFWDAYPKKRSKGDAFKVWKSIKPGEELQARILKSVAEHAASRDWQKAGGKYIPWPAKWLRAEGWEDTIEAWHDPDELPPIGEIKWPTS